MSSRSAVRSSTSFPFIPLALYFVLPSFNDISLHFRTGLNYNSFKFQYCGLVALTSTPLNCNARLRDLLSRPLNERLELLLPVGRPHEDATVPALHRKSLEEIMVKIWKTDLWYFCTLYIDSCYIRFWVLKYENNWFKLSQRFFKNWSRVLFSTLSINFPLTSINSSGTLM